MRLFLAHVQVDHRNDENDTEENQSRRTRSTLVVLGQGVVDETNHRIQATRRTRRAHRVAENTDDT